MGVKRMLPTEFVVADEHVDARPEDPSSLVELGDHRSGRITILPASEAHGLDKKRSRRIKRESKARGNRWLRRTAKIPD